MKTLSKISSSLLIAFLLLSLHGCATGPKIQNELNPEVQIQDFSTFALLPLPQRIPGASPGTILRYGKTAQDAVKESLTAKGYTEASIEEADFSINIKATIVPKVNVTNWGFDYGYYSRPGYRGGFYPYGSMGSSVDVDSYEEGTLILEAFDSKTKALAWVGWASSRKSSKPMEHEALKLLIDSILATYPSK